jgi:hypothetical protein
MIWNNHSKLEGQHAFLGASKYHWINYDSEKIAVAYMKFLATQKGTELHALAADLIKHKVKLPKSKKTFNMYVNDAIGYGMKPEQVLYYSMNAFGTADSIIFKNGLLRIHDLKTGTTPTSEHQLEIYAALFCLEYNQKPNEIDMELRIYQNDEVRVYLPDPDAIFHIMDKIIIFDKKIEELKAEE